MHTSVLLMRSIVFLYSAILTFLCKCEMYANKLFLFHIKIYLHFFIMLTFVENDAIIKGKN